MGDTSAREEGDKGTGDDKGQGEGGTGRRRATGGGIERARHAVRLKAQKKTNMRVHADIAIFPPGRQGIAGGETNGDCKHDVSKSAKSTRETEQARVLAMLARLERLARANKNNKTP